jgi:hypothetical protein
MDKTQEQKDQLEQLVNKALEQPGVRDLMALYQKLNAVEVAAHPYARVARDQQSIVLSNASCSAPDQPQ